MEPNNIQQAAKRFWNLVRGAWLVLRKGISKRKLLMLDLHHIFKRGKLAGKNIMHNIMSHHHASTGSATITMPPDEYEFSCSNTPAHASSFPFAFHMKRKQQQPNFFGSCSHAPHTSEEDEDEDAIARQLSQVSEALARSPSVEAFLQSPAVSEMMYAYYSEAPSPALPGFGRTPLARQLRVTDSPFPLADNSDDRDNCQVDAAAEEFIGKFYEQLRKQQIRGKGPTIN